MKREVWCIEETKNGKTSVCDSCPTKSWAQVVLNSRRAQNPKAKYSGPVKYVPAVKS